MDETAKAIARMREEAKASQTEETDRPTHSNQKPEKIHAGSATGRKMSSAVGGNVLTKRQKSG